MFVVKFSGEPNAFKTEMGGIFWWAVPMLAPGLDFAKTNGICKMKMSTDEKNKYTFLSPRSFMFKSVF